MDEKIRIIFLAPGPVYEPESSAYAHRFELLSHKMTGTLLTTSNAKHEVDIANFHFSTVKRRGGNFTSGLIVFWHCVKFAFKMRRKKAFDCIVSYDPLRSGLIGCVMKQIMRIPLITEVNGVYTSEAAWMDEPPSPLVSLKKKLIPMLMSFVFKRADGVKLQFPNQIDQFRHLLKGATVRAFPNLIPIEKFVNLGEENEVLLVGFPYKLKGVDLLIEAFRQIADDHPDWRLKILGWYPDPTLLLATIGDNPRIEHHPPVHYKEIQKHIGRTGVVAQPSRTDALPRVLVEAAAAGKARIASNVDGIPIAIEDEIDGLLFESENVSELATKLSRLMADKKLRQRLGQKAHEKAHSLFSPEVFLENTYNLYSDSIRGKTRST